MADEDIFTETVHTLDDILNDDVKPRKRKGRKKSANIKVQLAPEISQIPLSGSHVAQGLSEAHSTPSHHGVHRGPSQLNASVHHQRGRLQHSNERTGSSQRASRSPFPRRSRSRSPRHSPRHSPSHGDRTSHGFERGQRFRDTVSAEAKNSLCRERDLRWQSEKRTAGCKQTRDDQTRPDPTRKESSRITAKRSVDMLTSAVVTHPALSRTAESGQQLYRSAPIATSITAAVNVSEPQAKKAKPETVPDVPVVPAAKRNPIKIARIRRAAPHALLLETIAASDATSTPPAVSHAASTSSAASEMPMVKRRLIRRPPVAVTHSDPPNRALLVSTFSVGTVLAAVDAVNALQSMTADTSAPMDETVSSGNESPADFDPDTAMLSVHSRGSSMDVAATPRRSPSPRGSDYPSTHSVSTLNTIKRTPLLSQDAVFTARGRPPSGNQHSPEQRTHDSPRQSRILVRNSSSQSRSPRRDVGLKQPAQRIPPTKSIRHQHVHHGVLRPLIGERRSNRGEDGDCFHSPPASNSPLLVTNADSTSKLGSPTIPTPLMGTPSLLTTPPLLHTPLVEYGSMAPCAGVFETPWIVQPRISASQSDPRIDGIAVAAAMDINAAAAEPLSTEHHETPNSAPSVHLEISDELRATFKAQARDVIVHRMTRYLKAGRIEKADFNGYCKEVMGTVMKKELTTMMNDVIRQKISKTVDKLMIKKKR